MAHHFCLNDRECAAGGNGWRLRSHNANEYEIRGRGGTADTLS
jgi:hypothetical protein